jgi:hypothetical protein
VLTGLVVATALPYLGIRPGMLSLDEKAELLFINQGYANSFDSTIVILEVEQLWNNFHIFISLHLVIELLGIYEVDILVPFGFWSSSSSLSTP